VFRSLGLLLALLVGTVHGISIERADSLAMAGAAGLAEEELLALIADGSDTPEELLFRLCGLFHATGRESECLLLLESLEETLDLDLTGWKVSLLDLARRQGEAAALAPDDVLLNLWLDRTSGDPSARSYLPQPESIAGRAVRSMNCPDGTMTRVQIDQTVFDSALLPFLADEVADELELSLETAGPWWDDVAEDLWTKAPSDDLAKLIALRREHLFAGTEEYWSTLLHETDERAAAAASMLLRLAPEEWSDSWEVTDVLVSFGRMEVVDSLLAFTADSVFAIGLEMALLRASGRYGELLALCDSMPEVIPDSLAARALLYRARALRALQRPHSVYYDAYLTFAVAHIGHPTSSEAAYLAAKYYDAERNWPAAADAYLTSLASGTYGGSLTYWRGGFSHYMCGRGMVGDSIWAAGISTYPYSVWSDEMRFWRARYANRTGDFQSERHLLEETAESHPWEFYGLLAAFRLGRSLPTCSETAHIDLNADPVLAAALNMYSMGYGSMASLMLRTTSLGNPGTRGAALALMGEHGRSLALLREWDTELRGSGEGMLPDSLLAFYFPAPYRDLTEELTAGLTIPGAAVTALMRQESYFNRWAGSSVGARGLIQLMPGTAGDISRWYGLPVLSGNDFYDPENSIQFGSIYLDRQYRSFDGSLLLAMAAYNAGPGSASRWMNDFPMEPDDPELFIEQVTYIVTRRYIKKVMANAWLYEGASI